MKKFSSHEEVQESNYVGFYHLITIQGDLIIGFKTEGSICNDFFYYGVGDVMKEIYDTIVKGLYLLEEQAKQPKQEIETNETNETISVQSLIELINTIKK